MNYDKFKNWIFESKGSKTRNFFVLVGPPAVGKSSWVRSLNGSKKVISKDDIIEDIIFPKYRLANEDIFKSKPESLKPGEEHPEKKRLGKVIKYKRFSKSKGREVEELEYENAYAAAQELNSIYNRMIEDAISSDVENIIIDAIHMNRNTRETTLDIVRGNPEFKTICVVFPHSGYEKQIKASADARAKDFLDRYGSDFTRGVAWQDYEEMYKKYQEPDKSEGFDEIIQYNRFNKTDRELALKEEDFVKSTREYLESGLSKYWKKRAESRSKNARREAGNQIDLEWAKLQQEKSKKMNSKIYKIFERELENSEELSEQVEELLNKIRSKREIHKKKMQEKKAAKLNSPKKLPKKKTLPSPYKDAKVTSKFPYSKDRTGGVAKVYRKRSKQAGGPTIAPGESFGPIGENNDENNKKSTK